MKKKKLGKSYISYASVAKVDSVKDQGRLKNEIKNLKFEILCEISNWPSDLIRELLRAARRGNELLKIGEEPVFYRRGMCLLYDERTLTTPGDPQVSSEAGQSENDLESVMLRLSILIGVAHNQACQILEDHTPTSFENEADDLVAQHWTIMEMTKDFLSSNKEALDKALATRLQTTAKPEEVKAS